MAETFAETFKFERLDDHLQYLEEIFQDGWKRVKLAVGTGRRHMTVITRDLYRLILEWTDPHGGKCPLSDCAAAAIIGCDPHSAGNAGRMLHAAGFVERVVEERYVFLGRGYGWRLVTSYRPLAERVVLTPQEQDVILKTRTPRPRKAEPLSPESTADFDRRAGEHLAKKICEKMEQTGGVPGNVSLVLDSLKETPVPLTVQESPPTNVVDDPEPKPARTQYRHPTTVLTLAIDWRQHFLDEITNSDDPAATRRRLMDQPYARSFLKAPAPPAVAVVPPPSSLTQANGQLKANGQLIDAHDLAVELQAMDPLPADKKFIGSLLVRLANGGQAWLSTKQLAVVGKLRNRYKTHEPTVQIDQDEEGVENDGEIVDNR